jgi:hypothetical protein
MMVKDEITSNLVTTLKIIINLLSLQIVFSHRNQIDRIW